MLLDGDKLGVSFNGKKNGHRWPVIDSVSAASKASAKGLMVGMQCMSIHTRPVSDPHGNLLITYKHAITQASQDEASRAPWYSSLI